MWEGKASGVKRSSIISEAAFASSLSAGNRLAEALPLLPQLFPSLKCFTITVRKMHRLGA